MRFDQVYKGVPVYGGEVKVSLDRQSVVVFVMNGYSSRVALDDVTPRIGAVAAREAAARHLNVQGPVRYDRTDLVVYPGKAGARLAYRVVIEPASPLGSWETLVDARTGAVFRVEDKSCYGSADGTGTVFNPDPLSSAAVLNAAVALGYSVGDLNTIHAQYTATGYSVVIVPVELMSVTVE